MMRSRVLRAFLATLFLGTSFGSGRRRQLLLDSYSPFSSDVLDKGESSDVRKIAEEIRRRAGLLDEKRNEKKTASREMALLSGAAEIGFGELDENGLPIEESGAGVSEALKMRGTYLLSLGRYGEALEVYREALKRDADSEAAEGFASAAFHIMQPSEFLKTVDKLRVDKKLGALFVNPEIEVLRLAAASEVSEDEARRVLREVDSGKFKDVPKVRLEKAVVLEEIGDKLRAELEYNAILASEGVSERVLSNAAKLLVALMLQTGRAELAEQRLAELEAKGVGGDQIRLIHATVLSGLGRYDKIERVVEGIKGKSAKVRGKLLLAKAMKRMGQPGKAIRLLQEEMGDEKVDSVVAEILVEGGAKRAAMRVISQYIKNKTKLRRVWLVAIKAVTGAKNSTRLVLQRAAESGVLDLEMAGDIVQEWFRNDVSRDAAIGELNKLLKQKLPAESRIAVRWALIDLLTVAGKYRRAAVLAKKGVRELSSRESKNRLRLQYALLKFLAKSFKESAKVSSEVFANTGDYELKLRAANLVALNATAIADKLTRSAIAERLLAMIKLARESGSREFPFLLDTAARLELSLLNLKKAEQLVKEAAAARPTDPYIPVTVKLIRRAVEEMD